MSRKGYGMTQTKKYIWQWPSWPEFRWDNAALLKLLGISRFQQGSLLTQMKDLGFDVRQQARAEVLVEEALKTSDLGGGRSTSYDICWDEFSD